jgi:hypothetical protein
MRFCIRISPRETSGERAPPWTDRCKGIASGSLFSVRRCSGAQVRRCSSVPVRRCSGAQVLGCAGAQVLQCAGAQVLGCAGARVRRCAGARVRRCSSVPVRRCSGAQVLQCAGARVLGCAGAPVRRFQVSVLCSLFFVLCSLFFVLSPFAPPSLRSGLRLRAAAPGTPRCSLQVSGLAPEAGRIMRCRRAGSRPARRARTFRQAHATMQRR